LPWGDELALMPHSVFCTDCRLVFNKKTEQKKKKKTKIGHAPHTDCFSVLPTTPNVAFQENTGASIKMPQQSVWVIHMSFIQLKL